MIEKSKDSKSFFSRDPCNSKKSDKKYDQYNNDRFDDQKLSMINTL